MRQTVIAVDTAFHAEPVVPDGIVNSAFHAGTVMAPNLAVLDRAAADLVLTPALAPVAEVTLANRQALARAGARAALQQIDRLRALFKKEPRTTLSMRTWPPPPLRRALDPPNHASIGP